MGRGGGGGFSRATIYLHCTPVKRSMCIFFFLFFLFRVNTSYMTSAYVSRSSGMSALHTDLITFVCNRW